MNQFHNVDLYMIKVELNRFEMITKFVDVKKEKRKNKIKLIMNCMKILFVPYLWGFYNFKMCLKALM